MAIGNPSLLELVIELVMKAVLGGKRLGCVLSLVGEAKVKVEMMVATRTLDEQMERSARLRIAMDIQHEAHEAAAKGANKKSRKPRAKAEDGTPRKRAPRRRAEDIWSDEEPEWDGSEGGESDDGGKNKRRKSDEHANRGEYQTDDFVVADTVISRAIVVSARLPSGYPYRRNEDININNGGQNILTYFGPVISMSDTPHLAVSSQQLMHGPIWAALLTNTRARQVSVEGGRLVAGFLDALYEHEEILPNMHTLALSHGTIDTGSGSDCLFTAALERRATAGTLKVLRLRSTHVAWPELVPRWRRMLETLDIDDATKVNIESIARISASRIKDFVEALGR